MPRKSTPSVTAYLSEHELLDLRRLAESEGKALSELLREAVARLLSTRQASEKFAAWMALRAPLQRAENDPRANIPQPLRYALAAWHGHHAGN